jgi:hypothetical protein
VLRAVPLVAADEHDVPRVPSRGRQNVGVLEEAAGTPWPEGGDRERDGPNQALHRIDRTFFREAGLRLADLMPR